MLKRLGVAAISLGCLVPASEVHAGGYDTPMLYSARHMGMGGTAVSYVNDPSALFHNPAGLANIEGTASFMGDFSLLVGDIEGSPSPSAINIESNPTIAPFFLIGGAGKVRLSSDVELAFGAAVYPVASAAATYEYENLGTPVTDRTRLVFFEFSPGVAVKLFDQLTLGASYRITYVTLERSLQPGTLDFEMSGLDFEGVRFGAQWEAVPDHLSVGLHYRHKTVTNITNDSGLAIQEFNDIEADFTLPSRLTAGIRGDFNNVGLAFDFEYGFNSQNVESVLMGTDPNNPDSMAAVPNVFEWSDAITLRFGGEYNIAVGGYTVSPRLGFIFDDRTANPDYPTAFGTPPAPTYVGTVGVGFDAGPWEANFAYAYRRGSTVVPEPSAGARNCAFCSEPGDYTIELNGIYLDFSYNIE